MNVRNLSMDDDKSGDVLIQPLQMDAAIKAFKDCVETMASGGNLLVKSLEDHLNPWKSPQNKSLFIGSVDSIVRTMNSLIDALNEECTSIEKYKEERANA